MAACSSRASCRWLQVCLVINLIVGLVVGSVVALVSGL